MLTLEQDRLTIRFPEIHPDAVCHIDFQRTLRIPDDNRTHSLPPGLGRFPLAHVDDHSAKLPAAWQKRGGVFLPMHETEAMWIKFSGNYPFAVKIAAGKINAVTGKPWTPELKGPRKAHPLQQFFDRNAADQNAPCGSGFPSINPPFGQMQPLGGVQHPRLVPAEDEQDYVTLPKQNWLDGFCVSKGKIRQFVAMPMGEGYTAEEQITGEAVHGGLQIIVYPLKPEFYRRAPMGALRSMNSFAGAMESSVYGMCASASASVSNTRGLTAKSASAVADMGMAPGGLMEQSIHEDSFGIDKFDQSVSAKCFVHLLNSQQYEMVTGKKPPHAAPTAADYTKHGLPWFKESPTGSKALAGGAPLQKLDSVANLGNKLGKNPLPENAPLPGVPKVLMVGHPNLVREGEF